MQYFSKDDIVVRDMKKEDIETIHSENISCGWHSNISVYQQYFDKQESGELYVFVAEYNGAFAGYTTLSSTAKAGPFANQGISEVSDFNVFTKYRRKGIGSIILDVAENTAKQLGQTISLGVGLHSGYGSAQRIYIKRGYVPDGTGVWFRDKQLGQYADCCNDDDLVIYLSKQLY